MQCFEYSLLFCCCALAWVTFQVAVFFDCARNVFETIDKSWEVYQQRVQPPDIGGLAADLSLTHDDTETFVVLGLLRNLETIDLSLELTEQWLFTREIIHSAECASWVASKIDLFAFPAYVDTSFTWMSVMEQVQGLRKEIEYARIPKDQHVPYEKDLHRLRVIYDSVLKKFYNFKRTIEKISVIEADFQSMYRRIPFQTLALLVPRWFPNFLPQIVKSVVLCDQGLKKHPVYTLQWAEEEYYQQHSR